MTTDAVKLARTIIADGVCLPGEQNTLARAVLTQEEELQRLRAIIENTKFYFRHENLTREISPWLRAQWNTLKPDPTQEDANRAFDEDKLREALREALGWAEHCLPETGTEATRRIKQIAERRREFGL